MAFAEKINTCKRLVQAKDSNGSLEACLETSISTFPSFSYPLVDRSLEMLTFPQFCGGADMCQVGWIGVDRVGQKVQVQVKCKY